MALPVTVLIILPVVLISLFPYVPLWGVRSLFLFIPITVGLFSLGSGSVLLCLAISTFVKNGEGTIAPWTPKRKLIVTGLYAHVRNPMHIGAFLILTGESIIIGAFPLTAWTLLFIIGNLIYVSVVEEQKLAERFGDEYLVYKRNVPRWIPRLSSWKPTSQNQKPKRHMVTFR